MEVVKNCRGKLSTVLARHLKLRNNLQRPTMEEIGYRTNIFTLDGIAGSQREYIQWFLKYTGIKINQAVFWPPKPSICSRRNCTPHSWCSCIWRCHWRQTIRREKNWKSRGGQPWREGNYRYSDGGGVVALAVMLGKITHATVIFTTKASPSDPNFYDNNDYKERLKYLIAKYNPLLLLDIHGSHHFSFAINSSPNLRGLQARPFSFASCYL